MSDPNQPYTYSSTEDSGQSRSDFLTQFNSYFIPLKRLIFLLIPIVAASVYYRYNEVKDIPTRYQSKSSMMVMGQINLPDNRYYLEVANNFFGTQTELLRSKEVRRRARERVLAMHPEYEDVSKQISMNAGRRGESNIFDLTATGRHAGYVKAYLNAVMEAYLNFREENRSSRTGATISQINSEISRLDKEIQKMEEKLQNFLNENSMVFIEEQASNAASYLVNLNSELANLEKELQLIKLYEKQHQEDFADPQIINRMDESSMLENIARRGEAYLNTLRKLRDVEAEKERFSQVLQNTHPKMKKFERRLQYLKNRLQQHRKSAKRDILERKQNLSLKIKNVEQSIKEWKKRSKILSSKKATYDRMNSQLDRFKKLYDQKLSSLRNIESASNVAMEPITIAERASSARSIEPNVYSAMVEGGIWGTIGGMAFLLGLIRWRAKIYTEADMPKELPYPTIAYIPRMSTRKKVELLEPDDDRYAFLEAFRNLRSYILTEFPGTAENRQAKVISITSAIPTEGKSTVSSNISISMAMAGKKVLLVDADLRQGTQHRLFHMPSSPGLSDYLENKVKFDEVIQNGVREGLDILPRGDSRMNSSELLLTGACEKMFLDIQKNYDYIILDTPPIMATDDTANLLKYIDIVFLVSRMSLSTRRTLVSATRMLEARRALIGGFVLNYCNAATTDYYRYKYYGYQHF